MKKLINSYIKILAENKLNFANQLNCSLLNLIENPIKHDLSDFFFVNDDVNRETIIFEDVYKSYIFKNFINDVNTLNNITFYSLDKMKNYLVSKLKPIKNNVDILLIKCNFYNKPEFINIIDSIFINDEYYKNSNFYNNIFNNLQNLSGACWRVNEKIMIMFLNTKIYTNITIMHECIHYIQIVTERSILKQSTYLEKQNNPIFTNSECIAYLNTLCHILEEKNISKKNILREFNNILKIRSMYISKNEHLTYNEFKEKCLNMYLIKILNNEVLINWLLTCVYYNKHISVIRSHLINYFN